MKPARLSLDGHQVMFCEAAFSGRFAVELEDADRLVYGEPLVWVVVAHPNKIELLDNRAGDLGVKCRLSLDAIRLPSEEVSSTLAEMLDLESFLPGSETPPDPPQAAIEGPRSDVEPEDAPEPLIDWEGLNEAQAEVPMPVGLSKDDEALRNFLMS